MPCPQHPPSLPRSYALSPAPAATWTGRRFRTGRPRHTRCTRGQDASKDGASKSATSRPVQDTSATYPRSSRSCCSIRHMRWRGMCANPPQPSCGRSARYRPDPMDCLPAMRSCTPPQLWRASGKRRAARLATNVRVFHRASCDFFSRSRIAPTAAANPRISPRTNRNAPAPRPRVFRACRLPADAFSRTGKNLSSPPDNVPAALDCR